MRNPASAGFFLSCGFALRSDTIAASDDQRRSAGTRQVQRARPPLVGPGKRVPAAARDQSAAPRLDRRARRRCAASACSTSAAAAASSPTRWRGAAPRCSASTWPTKPLRVAQLHALEAGTPRIEYREVAVEALAAEQPDAFDVVTCMEMLEHVPDPASIVAACARARSSPAAGCSSRRINRNPKAFLFAIVGAEHVLQPAAQGHARVRALHPPERAGALVPRRRARPAWPRAAWNTTR